MLELAYVANIKIALILSYLVTFAIKNTGKFLELTCCLHVLREIEKFSVLLSNS